MNQTKFGATFYEGFLEAVQTGLKTKPITAAGLSVQVVRKPGGDLVLRAFLVDKDAVELAEIASTPYHNGEVVTLFNLDQPFVVRLAV